MINPVFSRFTVYIPGQCWAPAGHMWLKFVCELVLPGVLRCGPHVFIGLAVRHIAEITVVSSTSHPANPVIPHLSSPHVPGSQCAVSRSDGADPTQGVPQPYASGVGEKGCLWLTRVVY